MSNEKQSPLDALIAEKVAAGLPRADAEVVAKRQLAEDEAAAAKAAAETEAKKAKK